MNEHITLILTVAISSHIFLRIIIKCIQISALLAFLTIFRCKFTCQVWCLFKVLAPTTYSKKDCISHLPHPGIQGLLSSWHLSPQACHVLGPTPIVFGLPLLAGFFVREVSLFSLRDFSKLLSINSISSSRPAYFCHFSEARAGVEEGCCMHIVSYHESGYFSSFTFSNCHLTSTEPALWGRVISREQIVLWQSFTCLC